MRKHYAGELPGEQTLSVAQRCREAYGSNIMTGLKLFLANGEHPESFVSSL